MRERKRWKDAECCDVAKSTLTAPAETRVRQLPADPPSIHAVVAAGRLARPAGIMHGRAPSATVRPSVRAAASPDTATDDLVIVRGQQQQPPPHDRASRSNLNPSRSATRAATTAAAARDGWSSGINVTCLLLLLLLLPVPVVAARARRYIHVSI